LQKAPLPFDSVNDFAPVATLARTGLFLVVHPALPVANLKQSSRSLLFLSGERQPSGFVRTSHSMP
jgi:tripartite-type tricarboxylate transporter receptor subunit TctC